MTPPRIRHVDAFTTVPLEGNPAAVVDGDGLDGATMQRIALNQHLSETVFLLPPQAPEADLRLRIFTPWQELPFAGHPVVAAAHVVISERIVAQKEGPLRLETGAGVLPIEVTPGPPAVYTMTQAAPQFRPSAITRDQAARCLGLEAGDVVSVEDVATGLWWPVARLASFEAMLRVRPDFGLLRESALALFALGAADPAASVRVRAFAPGYGVDEDPVTGSANGCIGALIARDGLLPAEDGEVRYMAEQGVEMGQPGRVHLRVSGPPDALTVRVGGSAVTVLRGELLLS